MQLTICTANCTGNQKNCLYPNKSIVTSGDELKEAVKFDHVCAEYKNSYRSADNFLKSDVIVMDCDNDHSDDPKEWISMDSIDELMSDISYAIAPSRNNMVSKDGKTARPKFHVYFPIDTVTDADSYTLLKIAIHSQFPFFDDNALDAARFIFGADCSEVIWHEGWLSVTDVLSEVTEDFNANNDVIPTGRRNKTLSHYAGRVLKRFGICDKAHELFLKEAEKCEIPVGDEELNTIWNSAVKFAKKIQVQEGYISPEDFNSDFDTTSLKPADYSDIGQAKVLAREYDSELCFTEATDYLRYDGEKWVESKQKAVGAMEEFLDEQLADAENAVKVALEACLEAGLEKSAVITGKGLGEMNHRQQVVYVMYVEAVVYKKFVLKRRDMKYVTAALQAAKPMLQHSISDLDKDEFLLNMPGATIDLRTGESRLPEAADFITKQTNVKFGSAGKGIWEEALATFFCSNVELIEYVQQIVGLAAIGKVYMEAIIIAYGEGRNGKSTFWNTISRVLGSYSGSLSADTLTVGCRRNVKPEMAELKGKRLILAAELEEGMRLNISIIKQLCSTDEITAEKKYKDPFRFIPSHTLVLYTNHLPRVGANDAGTWRRLIVIPFNAKIEGNSDIKNYADFLFNEAGPYILSWIIEGATKAISKSYHIALPECVRNAIDVYRDNNDWMANFLDDCCEIGPDYEQKSGEFYQEYRNYCARNGEYTRSTSDFYTAVELAGFSRRKLKKGSFIYGVRLKPEDFMN